MEKMDFFYTVKPKKKSVTKQEFEEFITKYPRDLQCDVTGICDPPAISYNDFELANRWPFSIVANTWAYSDNPNDYYYSANPTYYIMENYEAVFNSRTGNKATDKNLRWYQKLWLKVRWYFKR